MRQQRDSEAGKMLYLIGLGLGDAADITVKGLQAVKSCSRVYLEAYTSILTVGKEALVSPNTLTDPGTGVKPGRTAVLLRLFSVCLSVCLLLCVSVFI